MATFNAQLQSVLKRITDKKILEEIGEFVVQLLMDRVRGEGKGVKREDGNKGNLKPLTPGYIAQRKRDRDLHPDTTPNTSNLTRTGEMLDSLRYRVKGGKLEVYVQGQKAILKATYTNEARPWVNLGRAEKTQISKLLEKLIKDQL